MFQNLAQARQAAEALGQKIRLPEEKEEALSKYKARLKAHKDGRLVMHILKRPGQKNKTLDGWISKNDKWVKMFDVLTDTKKDEVSYGEHDNLIRQLVSPSCEDAGWYLRANDGTWQRFSTEKVKLRLIAMGHAKPEAELILGSYDRKGMEVGERPISTGVSGRSTMEHQRSSVRLSTGQSGLRSNAMPPALGPHPQTLRSRLGWRGA